MSQVLTDFIKDSRLWVYGFGVEGQSTFQFLSSQGYQVSIVDGQDQLEVEGALEIVSGEGVNDFFARVGPEDFIIRSAGISPLKPELVLAQQRGARVSSQLDLFSRMCHIPIVGVTGTMGKGTTCSLIHHVLEAYGQRTSIGGNFGIPMLDLISQLDQLDCVILELSSFQLMDFQSAFDVSVYLRTTSEHLDWHRDQDEYIQAKAKLAAYQDASQCLIYYADSENCQLMARESAAEKWSFGISGSHLGFVDSQSLTFQWQGQEYRYDMSQGGLIGPHQLQNLGAAILTCLRLGQEPQSILEALKLFQGIEMRTQVVGDKSGIRYINDSYATRPDATIAATRAIEEPYALILGGSEKHADFEELATHLCQHPQLKAVFLIGQTAQRLEEIILKHNPSFDMRQVEVFEEALDQAQELLREMLSTSQSRVSLLLSPACASFGMFKNYKDRGYRFNNWVGAQ